MSWVIRHKGTGQGHMYYRATDTEGRLTFRYANCEKNIPFESEIIVFKTEAEAMFIMNSFYPKAIKQYNIHVVEVSI